MARRYKHRGGTRRLDGRGFTEISDREIVILKQLIEYDGAHETAAAIGISILSVFRVAAGFGHRCNLKTIDAVRRFFAEGND